MRRAERLSARPTAPSVVARRLCDLLLSFPCAAIGGIEWRVLARKYEERHATRLDPAALGLTSPLAAATALLWDVLRLVDADDADNPVVAVEDAVAMAPVVGSLGTWPSLYQTLCKIVLSHGAPEQQPEAESEHSSAPGSGSPAVACDLLLSRLKPLLQIHWHANFDESSLGYFSEEGTLVRIRKMKHLVQAVLRWRDQRVAWRATASPKASVVDEAVRPALQLLASRRHNDLVLRLIHGERPAQDPMPSWVPAACSGRPAETERSAAASSSCEPKLRAEGPAPAPRWPPGQLLGEPFDDPFEPPPELRPFGGLLPWLPAAASPLCSTSAPSELGPLSGSATPASALAWSFGPPSGPATPASASAPGLEAAASGIGTPVPGHFASGACSPGGVCTLLPVWFPGNFALVQSGPLGDRGVIPSGIVQQARALFEPAPVGGAPPCPRP